MADLNTALVLAKKYKSLLDRNGINTRLRLSHFFGQAYAESNLDVKAENLNYKVDTLLRVFPKYFKTKSFAIGYAMNPAKLANYVYANRMGNGNTASGDGYKYRGRWFFQITGLDNYKELSKDTGVDYVCDPDSKLTEADAMVTAIWYWNERNLNRFADQDNCDAVSDIINIGRVTKLQGDANGYAHRLKYTNYYKKLFNESF